MMLYGILMIATLLPFAEAKQRATIASRGSIEFPEEREACSKPGEVDVICISIDACPEWFDIVKKKAVPLSDMLRLRGLQCGFEGSMPKVCCQNETGSEALNDAEFDNHPSARLLNHSICGQVLTDKIIGGRRTSVFDSPWMALLAYKVDNKRIEYRCGGTIISKRYILTAAHCLPEPSLTFKLIGIRVGDHDLRTERDCDRSGIADADGDCAEGYQNFDINTAIPHPDYSRNTNHNDIALIRLSNDIDFRPDHVRPVCLPLGSAANFEATHGIVTGWGITKNGISSSELLKATLPIVPNKECSEIYGNLIWHKQICAGGTGHDSCNGDSGGPLLAEGIYHQSPRYIQYGIVSFGTKTCGIMGFPSIFTRVSEYTDWILDNIRD